MSTTVPFRRDTAFGPEDIAVMRDAFDRACTASARAGESADVQDVIALCILELAKTGERHPQILCDRALEALGLPSSPLKSEN